MKDSKRNRTNLKRTQSRKFNPVSKYAAKQPAKLVGLEPLIAGMIFKDQSEFKVISPKQ